MATGWVWGLGHIDVLQQLVHWLNGSSGLDQIDVLQQCHQGNQKILKKSRGDLGR